MVLTGMKRLRGLLCWRCLRLSGSRQIGEQVGAEPLKWACEKEVAETPPSTDPTLPGSRRPPEAQHRVASARGGISFGVSLRSFLSPLFRSCFPAYQASQKLPKKLFERDFCVAFCAHTSHERICLTSMSTWEPQKTCFAVSLQK